MLLLEYFITESRADDAHARYPDLEQEIEYLVKNDPSGNNKYLMWGAKMVSRGEDVRETAYLLSMFHDALAKIPQKDINTYKSLAELEVTIDQAEDVVSATQKRQTKEEGIKQVYEDDRWLVVEPLTWEASCIYGRGTKWCISARDQPQHWPAYKQLGASFAFIFDKTKDESDPMYKVAVTFHAQNIVDDSRERWESLDDWGKQDWLDSLNRQFGEGTTMEQLEAMVYTGAEVSDAENNRFVATDVQRLVGMDLWNKIREAIMQAQGIQFENVLRRTIRSLL